MEITEEIVFKIKKYYVDKFNESISDLNNPYSLLPIHYTTGNIAFLQGKIELLDELDSLIKENDSKISCDLLMAGIMERKITQEDDVIVPLLKYDRVIPLLDEEALIVLKSEDGKEHYISLATFMTIFKELFEKDIVQLTTTINNKTKDNTISIEMREQ